MEKTSGKLKPGRYALVPAPWLPGVWAQLGEYMEAALAHSCQYEWTGNELFQRIASGEFRMLVAFGPGNWSLLGGVVLSRGQREGRPYLAVVCCGGRDMDTWIDGAVELSMAIARREGADEVVVMGRKGWLRRLALHGLKERAVIAVAPVLAEVEAGADEALLAQMGSL